MQNLRVKYYKEGDWISEMKLAQGRRVKYFARTASSCIVIYSAMRKLLLFFFYIVSYFYLSDGEELKETYLFS